MLDRLFEPFERNLSSIWGNGEVGAPASLRPCDQAKVNDPVERSIRERSCQRPNSTKFAGGLEQPHDRPTVHRLSGDDRQTGVVGKRELVFLDCLILARVDQLVRS